MADVHSDSVAIRPIAPKSVRLGPVRVASSTARERFESVLELLQDDQIEAASEQVLPPLELAVVTIVSFLVVYLLGRFLVVVGLAFVAAVVVSGFGHLLSGSALVVAAVTLAVGVAGQAVIGNLVSGLFLGADPEFNVDDWIAWEGSEGVVEAIRFRVTRVRTADDEVITVPNTTLATTAIWRPYSRDRHRIVVRIGIGHREDPGEMQRVIRDVIHEVDGALSSPEPTVAVEDIAQDALWLRSLFWVGDPSREAVRDVRSSYLRTLQQRLQTEGITFSPPSEHELSGPMDVRER